MQKQKNKNQYFYQNEQRVVVKNQDLSKIKKLADILVWILLDDLLEVLVKFFKAKSKNPWAENTAKTEKKNQCFYQNV